MQEVVEAWVIGHWSVSRCIGDRHVNYESPPPNVIQVDCKKEDLPVPVYRWLVKHFTKDEDMVLEVGGTAGTVLFPFKILENQTYRK